jgi:hypothetical protein
MSKGEFEGVHIELPAEFTLTEASNLDNCSFCKETLRSHNLCAKCRTVNYCNVDCQRAHWKEQHKYVCAIFGEMLFDTFIKKAKNDAEAAFWVSLAYLNGTHVKKDERMAFEWAKKAAHGGNAESQYNLGLFYSCGYEWLPQDEKKAFEMFELAAKNGCYDAYVSLAQCYIRGNGVEVNFQEAIKLLEFALVYGDKECFEEAESTLKNLKDIMSEDLD